MKLLLAQNHEEDVASVEKFRKSLSTVVEARSIPTITIVFKVDLSGISTGAGMEVSDVSKMVVIVNDLNMKQYHR